MSDLERLLDRLEAELLAMSDPEILAERRPLVRHEAAAVIAAALEEAERGIAPGPWRPSPGAAVPRDPG